MNKKIKLIIIILVLIPGSFYFDNGIISNDISDRSINPNVIEQNTSQSQNESNHLGTDKFQDNLREIESNEQNEQLNQETWFEGESV